MPKILIYICIMAIVTYLIRMLPLTLIKKEITNKTIRSFLYYVPYVTLSVMTFPAILYVTGNIYSGIFGFAIALILSIIGKSLLTVAIGSSLVVLLSELCFTYFPLLF